MNIKIILMIKQLFDTQYPNIADIFYRLNYLYRNKII